MAKAKLPALNAKAPVQFPPNATNAKEQENSLPRKACWNATFATAAASCPSNATNASVAVNSSVKHAAEQAVKRAILRFRLNRHRLRNSPTHTCCCVRCNAIREARIKTGATSRFKSLLCYESNPDLKSRKISVSTGVGHTRR